MNRPLAILREASLYALLHLLCILLLCLLPGCTLTKPRPDPAGPPWGADSTQGVGSLPKPRFFSDTLAKTDATGKETEKKTAKPARAGLFSFFSSAKPQKEKRGKTKYKHVTIQQVIGDGNTVKAAGDTKLKGGSQLATDSSVLNVASQGGNLAAVRGDGNHLKQSAEVRQPPDWKARLAGPLGWVLGFAAAGGIGYLVVLWRRKKKAQELLS